MARKNKTLADLMRMAKAYGIADNALFVMELQKYSMQTKIINSMADQIEAGQDPDGLLAIEMRKQCDSSAKTFNSILSFLNSQAAKPEPKADKLEEFLND